MMQLDNDAIKMRAAILTMEATELHTAILALIARLDDMADPTPRMVSWMLPRLHEIASIPPADWSEATLLRAAADYLGLASREVAMRLDCHERMVRHWWSGKHPVPPEVRAYMRELWQAAAAVPEAGDWQFPPGWING